MSIWGKIGGVGIGLAFAGPLGALAGGLAGHVLVDRVIAIFGPTSRDKAFTTAYIALAAKMAKVDGAVTKAETAAFHEIVAFKESDRRRVERLFRLAQKTSDGFEAHAAQMANLLRREPKALEDVLDGLFHVAKADGAIHQREYDYLQKVATLFGFDESDFDRITARHVDINDDPYLMLGVGREESDAEIRRRYRSLVREHHPDREIGRGLPPQAVRAAAARLAAINTAYDRIVKERAIK